MPKTNTHDILDRLLAQGHITPKEAKLLRESEVGHFVGMPAQEYIATQRGRDLFMSGIVGTIEKVVKKRGGEEALSEPRVSPLDGFLGGLQVNAPRISFSAPVLSVAVAEMGLCFELDEGLEEPMALQVLDVLIDLSCVTKQRVMFTYRGRSNYLDSAKQDDLEDFYFDPTPAVPGTN